MGTEIVKTFSRKVSKNRRLGPFPACFLFFQDQQSDRGGGMLLEEQGRYPVTRNCERQRDALEEHNYIWLLVLNLYIIAAFQEVSTGQLGEWRE